MSLVQGCVVRANLVPNYLTLWHIANVEEIFVAKTKEKQINDQSLALKRAEAHFIEGHGPREADH